MTKSIYRQAAELIDSGVGIINGHGVRCTNRIFSCCVISALSGNTYNTEDPQRLEYEKFMTGGSVFETNEEAIIALLLFDEIVKNKDND